MSEKKFWEAFAGSGFLLLILGLVVGDDFGTGETRPAESRHVIQGERDHSEPDQERTVGVEHRDSILLE